MPRISVQASDGAVVLYECKHGVYGRPARLMARLDPDAADDTTVYLCSTAEGTAGTDDETTGIPMLVGEVVNDNMLSGDKWWITTDSASPVDVYFEVRGTK